MMKDRVLLGLLGCGTVGCGVMRILDENRREIEQRAGCGVEVKKVADIDWARPRPYEVPPEKRTTDPWEIVKDPDIDIAVEVIGGTRPALDLVLASFENGKSVVTCNKELMAKEGRTIMEAAARHGVDICFEGAVGAGIPVIRTVKESLAGNRMRRIVAILNGTTNYILTQMTRGGREFSEVLREAQERGYAEKDPSDDIGGFDPAYKLAILASVSFGSRVVLETVYREGIEGISPADMRYAAELGYVVKLLAIGADAPEGLELRVHPTMIRSDHPLAHVDDVYNAIYFEGSPVGEIMLFGRGAGAESTSSAVAGDVIDIARNIRHGSLGRVPCTCFEEKPAKSMEEVISKHYIRMLVADRPGVLAKIASIFGEEGVSLASVVQKSWVGELAEIVWVTHQVKERSLRRAIERIGDLEIVDAVANWMRLLEE
jgi:homoserine dehydrogenase